MDNRVINLKKNLEQLLKERPEVIATWEGGSIATGYFDQFSDLDLSIVIQTEDVEPIFSLLDNHFAQQYGILEQFRMPEPCWHGMSQCFYLINKMPPLFYCDIAVVKSENPHKFTEPDRHGNAVIWFDKRGIYSAATTPKEELETLAKRMYHVATDTAWLGIIELKKALARKNWIAAHMNYTIFINRHLVPLMNLKYRPCKADFGIRYCDRDYPPEKAALIAKLLQTKSCQDIEAHLLTALPLFQALKAELACLG